VLSLLLLIVLSPLSIVLLYKKNNIKRVKIGSSKVFRYNRKGILRFYSDLFNILRGVISFVGTPIEEGAADDRKYSYKPGLTGLVQINNLQDPSSIEKVEVIYLKNYSLALDLKIILKTLFG
jgi:hypothetical protein